MKKRTSFCSTIIVQVGNTKALLENYLLAFLWLGKTYENTRHVHSRGLTYPMLGSKAVAVSVRWICSKVDLIFFAVDSSKMQLKTQKRVPCRAMLPQSGAMFVVFCAVVAMSSRAFPRSV